MANGAYSFDGSNDGINFAHIAALDGATKLTIAFYIYPVASNFYDALLTGIGAATTGAGNSTGFQILHPAADATALYLACRNGATSNEKVTGGGVLTSAAWNPVWMVYDGTQGTADNRLRLWIAGTEIVSWASDTADFPTSLGTNDQKLTLGYDEESGSPGLFSNGRLADVGLLFGRAVTDGTIASHAAGMSIGNYVAAGDFWASFRVNQNDENASRTGTLVDAPSLTTGPTLTYPGAGGVVYTQLERGVRGLNRGLTVGG
jgi:Concanavalin A-like lectin/glucanases superfamily